MEQNMILSDSWVQNRHVILKPEHNEPMYADIIFRSYISCILVLIINGSISQHMHEFL